MPAPTRRIQIGSKMAPQVIMICFFELLFVGVYKAIIQLPLWKEKVRAPPKNEKLDKSWKII